MKKAVVVHCIDSLGIGGAETLLLTVIKKLPEYEHHIITLIPDVGFDEIREFAFLHCVHHTGWIKTIRTCSRIKRLVRQLKPEFIHAHLFLSSFLSRLALNHRHNFTYSIHNLFGATIFKSLHLRAMEKWIYHPSQKLIAVSKYVLDDYKSVVVGCKTGNVLYDFIDDSFFEQPRQRQIKKIPLKWVAVGSFKKQKNYFFTIECIEALTHVYPDENISLDIYGDGPMRSLIEKRIEGLPFIVLKGTTNRLSTILDQYDACISTSEYEGYGIAPMEAMARGLPVFLSDIPVYREIYGDHSFLFSIHDNNCRDFLTSVESYSSKTFKEKEEAIMAGYQYAVKTASSENYISQLLSIYKS